MSGAELWASDGTEAGTVLVKDILPGLVGSMPQGLVFTGVGQRVVFAAFDPISGMELWESDGTSAGTKLVRDLAAGASSSNPKNIVVIGSSIFFSADDGSIGRELWAEQVPSTPQR
ncbi:MAG: ELWxxDGT repeat protein [Planctomycetota bacterium]